jgi:sarcosine oxidase / L-pipecolate oxidase
VSVDVFDKWPVPSRDAASTDTTKIIRADYIEPIYAKIASEAVELWKTDLYKGTYHQTGFRTLKNEIIFRMDFS